MTSEKMKDIVEWDVTNWSRALAFWEENSFIPIDDLKGKNVLDLGGRNGGLALYWALKGANVICSDIEAGGFDKAKRMHEKYGVSDRITYEVIDATDIPYKDKFDIITFKSVLGGVGYNNHFERQEQMMINIYDALKEDGMCYFAENLVASRLHSFARKTLIPWGGGGDIYPQVIFKN